MHLNSVYKDMVNTGLEVIASNTIVKFIYGSFAVYISSVLDMYPLMIKAVVGLYILDWITGLLKARKFHIFSSRAFFRGLTKIFVYGIYIYVGITIDQTIGINVLTPLFLTGIILTDGISVLENLDELGVEDKTGILKTFKTILRYNRKKIFEEKLKQFGGGALIDIAADFKQMKTVYIPMIPKEHIRKMFEIKIQFLEELVYKINDLKVNDGHIFKLQFNLLLDNTGKNLEDKLRKCNFPKPEIEEFLKRHGFRVDLYKKEVTNLLQNVDGNLIINEQIKTNIVQATIRIIYKGISDNAAVK